MHALQRILVCLLVLILAGHAGVGLAADEVVVIVHRDNPHAVDKAYVAGLYTGRIKGWPDGSPVFTLDQGEGAAARAPFYQRVVGRSLANMQAMWSQNIFAGKGLPPKLATPGSEMKRIVSSNRHAIGYILSSELDDSVRVLLP